jgi:hypothetical protein
MSKIKEAYNKMINMYSLVSVPSDVVELRNMMLTIRKLIEDSHVTLGLENDALYNNGLNHLICLTMSATSHLRFKNNLLFL